MNSGVQDSQNLAWKLIARLRWGAGDALLDTYEDERLPVARFNGEQCLVNTRRMAETGWLLKDPTALSNIEKPEGAPLRQKIIDAIPKQREQFFSQGQQFGQIYTSAAVLADGIPAVESSVSDYHPTGQPGARAPHIWLVDGTRREISTIDFYDGGFVLLAAADSEEWAAAAARIAESAGAPVRLLRIGASGLTQRAGDPDWRQTYAIEADGAALIRPDGHVGARWARLPADPPAALADALRSILAKTTVSIMTRSGLRPQPSASQTAQEPQP